MTLEIKPDHIHLWHIDLTLPIDNTLLSPVELKCYQQFKLATRKQEYGLSRVALRQILARYLDIDPHAIVYEYNQFGKPNVAGSVQFNLSHTKDTAVIAVALHDIGVDIESCQRTIANTKALAKRFFHPNELQWILAHPISEQTTCFLRCWSAKEAIIKAIGTGLSQQLDTFSVVEQNQVRLPNKDTWYLYPCSKQGMIGYIAYPQPNCEIIHYQFT